MKHFFKNLFYFLITIITSVLIIQTLINAHKENIKTELNKNY